MAQNPMPAVLPFPQGYPQVERESGASTRTYGFSPFSAAKGDLGFESMRPSDAFAAHPDPAYTPFTNVRRGG
jgi:hypothetical protein